MNVLESASMNYAFGEIVGTLLLLVLAFYGLRPIWKYIVSLRESREKDE